MRISMTLTGRRVFMKRGIRVPTIASTIAAFGPRSSSDVNSITNDGGITTFVMGRCNAMNEAPSAAVIRRGNSKTRFGSGHPVRARNAARPTETAAKIAANHRLEDLARRAAAEFDTAIRRTSEQGNDQI